MYIDTNSVEQMEVGLIRGGKIKKRIIREQYRHAEKLLPSVISLLASQKATSSDLRGIAVVSGPGSFSSLRVGVTLANTFAYALRIPIIGLESGMEISAKEIEKKITKKKKIAFVLPKYGKEPNITKKKN